MAEKNVQCHIISPEGALFEGEADHVVMTLEKGEMAVYPLHANLMAKLGIGEVRVIQGDDKCYFAINSGFAQVANDEVTILVDRAIKPEDIQLADLEAEEAALAERKSNNELSFNDYFDAKLWLSARRRVKQKST